METLGPCRLYCGDCLEIVPTLQLDKKKTIVLCDPPYGGSFDTNYTRFTNGLSPSRNYHEGIVGDDKPFDPTPWLAYHKVILWGYQFFASKLPLGTILVWNKKRPNQLGKFLSDCELAWQKGGKGCYLKSIVWNGFDRETERGEKTLHPSQKPAALFSYCLDRLKVRAGDTILDPYMGSGPCALACLRRGLNYVGIEVQEQYFNIAKERLHKALGD